MSNTLETSTSPKTPHFLIVDDNPLDVVLIKRALTKANLLGEYEVAENGGEAISLFDAIVADSSRPCPDLIFLDINLPMVNGLEVLEHMRNCRRCDKTKIVMVTSSNQPEEREVMKLWNAEYFQKPPELSEYMKLGMLAKTILEADTCCSGHA